MSPADTHVQNSLSRLPTPGAGFVWDSHGGALVLRPQDEDVRAAFTTRVGGVSLEPWDTLNVSFAVGDDEDRVLANRDIAGRTIDAAPRWSNVRQVHGADVVRALHGLHSQPADAVWTDDSRQTVSVLGADCLPVLLVGDGRVAAAHAGWRGLIAGVVEAAGAAVGVRRAYVGPGIGGCCYDVDPDVVEAFRGAYGPDAVRDDRHVDLWGAATEAAQRSGAREVWTASLCTACNPTLYYSHRRDRGRTGRQALIACLP